MITKKTRRTTMTMIMSCWNFMYRSKLMSSTVCTNLTEAYGQPKAADGELGTPGLDHGFMEVFCLHLKNKHANKNDDTIASKIFSSLATWFFSKHGIFYVRFTWKCSETTCNSQPDTWRRFATQLVHAIGRKMAKNGPIQGRRSTFLVYRPQESRRDCLGAVEGTHHGSYVWHLPWGSGGFIVFQGCIFRWDPFFTNMEGKGYLHVASTENVIAKQAGINCKLPFW